MTGYNALQELLKYVFEHQKYAETKNGLLLTFQIGIFYFLYKNLCVEFIYLLIPFALSIITILFSFFPHMDNFISSFKKNNIYQPNIYFFDHIKNFSVATYLEAFLSEFEDKKNKDEQRYKDLGNQIITLSKITSNKYFLFKLSFILFFCSIVLTFIFTLLWDVLI